MAFHFHTALRFLHHLQTALYPQSLELRRSMFNASTGKFEQMALGDSFLTVLHILCLSANSPTTVTLYECAIFYVVQNQICVSVARIPKTHFAHNHLYLKCLIAHHFAKLLWHLIKHDQRASKNRTVSFNWISRDSFHFLNTILAV